MSQSRAPICIGNPTALVPDANEVGWKKTVRMNLGEVTTDLPKVPFHLPVSPHTGGHE